MALLCKRCLAILFHLNHLCKLKKRHTPFLMTNWIFFLNCQDIHCCSICCGSTAAWMKLLDLLMCFGIALVSLVDAKKMGDVAFWVLPSMIYPYIQVFEIFAGDSRFQRTSIIKYSIWNVNNILTDVRRSMQFTRPDNG